MEETKGKKDSPKDKVTGEELTHFGSLELGSDISVTVIQKHNQTDHTN